MKKKRHSLTTYEEEYILGMWRRAPWIYASEIAKDLWRSKRYAYRVYACLTRNGIHVKLIRQGKEEP